MVAELKRKYDELQVVGAKQEMLERVRREFLQESSRLKKTKALLVDAESELVSLRLQKARLLEAVLRVDEDVAAVAATADKLKAKIAQTESTLDHMRNTQYIPVKEEVNQYRRQQKGLLWVEIPPLQDETDRETAQYLEQRRRQWNKVEPNQ